MTGSGKKTTFSGLNIFNFCICFCVSLVGHVIKNNRFLANFHNSNLKKLSLGRPEILRINLVLYLKLKLNQRK